MGGHWLAVKISDSGEQYFGQLESSLSLLQKNLLRIYRNAKGMSREMFQRKMDGQMNPF